MTPKDIEGWLNPYGHTDFLEPFEKSPELIRGLIYIRNDISQPTDLLKPLEETRVSALLLLPFPFLAPFFSFLCDAPFIFAIF
jgi:hypothetical protein